MNDSIYVWGHVTTRAVDHLFVHNSQDYDSSITAAAAAIHLIVYHISLIR